MIFKYTAMTGGGQRVSDTLEAPSESDAQRLLNEQRLLVLSLAVTARSAARRGGKRPATGVERAAPLPRRGHGGGKRRQIAFFARQMSMMLRAGAPVVSALRSIAEQTHAGPLRTMLAGLADSVEQGAALHDAMSRYPQCFDPVTRSLVAAGESTGSLGMAFDRLTQLLETRQRVRAKLASALVYPAVVMLMSLNVALTLIVFVLPRFSDLFGTLGIELPTITLAMLAAGRIARDHWVLVSVVPAALVIAAAVWLRTESGWTLLQRLLLRLPFVGGVMGGILLARFLRVWSTLLLARVPLLESVRHARATTGHVDFQRLFAAINDAIIQGRPVHTVLRGHRLVPATICATIGTGEESGRLAESMDFVSAWLEEQNEARVGTLTRVIEPVMLLVMGGFVGGVCIALFLPLFDVATAA